ncbi:hypothetical protein SDJN03_01264, partial [Cucurbita argyrosperma subsp. sororia]
MIIGSFHSGNQPYRYFYKMQFCVTWMFLMQYRCYCRPESVPAEVVYSGVSSCDTSTERFAFFKVLFRLWPIEDKLIVIIDKVAPPGKSKGYGFVVTFKHG